MTSEDGTVVVFVTSTIVKLGTFYGPTLNGASQGIYGAAMSLDGTTFYVVDLAGQVVGTIQRRLRKRDGFRVIWSPISKVLSSLWQSMKPV